MKIINNNIFLSDSEIEVFTNPDNLSTHYENIQEILFQHFGKHTNVEDFNKIICSNSKLESALNHMLKIQKGDIDAEELIMN